MLVLKLRRIGKKHQPSYRLVVSERRSKAVGKYLEGLGWYNPRSKEHQFNKERILHWLQNGAQKTDTVHNLLIRSGIISGKKVAVHKVGQSSTNQKELKNNMDEQMNPTMPNEEGNEGGDQGGFQPAPEAPAAPEAPEAPAEGGEGDQQTVPEAPAAPAEESADSSSEEGGESQPSEGGEEKQW